jgi:hypothetical protein
MLVLVPDSTDYDAAVAQVQQILCEAMQEFVPGVPIETEYLLADRWYKCIDDQPRDPQGRIVPYQKPDRTGPVQPPKAVSKSAIPEQMPLKRTRPVYSAETLLSFLPPDNMLPEEQLNFRSDTA